MRALLPLRGPAHIPPAEVLPRRHWTSALFLAFALSTAACDAGPAQESAGESTTGSTGGSTGPDGSGPVPSTTLPEPGATQTSTDASSSGEPDDTSSTTSTASTSSGDGSTTGSEGSTSTTGDLPEIVPCSTETMSPAPAKRWAVAGSGRSKAAQRRFSTHGAVSGDEPTFEAVVFGGGFIPDPTDGEPLECSVWEQDCPEGEKCAAWADDGGTSWNATRCVPVDSMPAAPGEACQVEGNGVTGIDTCDLGSMCWDVDPETNVGECVALCEGSEAAPTCAIAGTACAICNEGVLNLCLPVCNPLADECSDGEGCYPVGDTFQCAPDGSGNGGEPGDACQYINACDNGNACVTPNLVPGCGGGVGCCSPLCLIGDDSQCLPGQECVPFFDEGASPAECLDAVGVCSVPA